MTARRAFVVQHDHNPTLLLKRSPDGQPAWTTELAEAQHFATEFFALRYITNWRNGKGHVLPVVLADGRANA